MSKKILIIIQINPGKLEIEQDHVLFLYWSKNIEKPIPVGVFEFCVHKIL